GAMAASVPSLRAPPVRPVAVMAAVPVVGGRRVSTVPLGVLFTPRLGRGRRRRRSGAGRRVGIRGRPLRRGVVTMRLLGPVMGRPAVTVMALFSQGLVPFLLEGQEKPHGRDAPYYPEAHPGSSPRILGFPRFHGSGPRRWPGRGRSLILSGMAILPRTRRGRWLFGTAALVAAGIGVDAFLIEPNWIEVVRSV